MRTSWRRWGAERPQRTLGLSTPLPAPYPAAPALWQGGGARPLAPSSFGVTGVPWVHPSAVPLRHLRADPRWEKSLEISKGGSKPRSEVR